MVAENWAHVRLSVQLEGSRSRGECTRLNWRLDAKPPGGSWDTRRTVLHGSERVAGVTFPPTRDDMLAAMTEVLLGIRWTGEGDPPF